MCRTLTLVVLLAPLAAQAQSPPQVESLVVRLDYLSTTPERFYTQSAPYQGALPAFGDRVAGPLNIEIQEPGDFGYTDVDHARTGQQVFRAGTVWAGGGSFEFPQGGSTDFGASGAPVVPASVETVLRFGSDEARAESAWQRISTTAPVRDLTARGPLDVIVFDHFYTVGGANPATAEWIVVVTTRPDAPRDLATVEIVWPGEVITAGHPFQFEATVHNFDDASDGGRLVLEADGTVVAEAPVTLGPGESQTLRLAPIRLDADAALTARLVPASGGADVHPGNNERSLSVEVTALPVFRPVSSLVYGGPVPLRGVPLDADGDGDLDVVQLNRAPSLHIRGDDGAFTDASDRLPDGLPLHPRHALGGDLTGDGVPDLLLVYWDHGPFLLRGSAAGPYRDITPEAGLGDVDNNRGPALVTDMDGDGDLDLLLSPDDVLVPFRNDGAGHFFQRAPTFGTSRIQSATLADLDGDGDLDLAVARWFEPGRVYENRSGDLVGRTGPWPGDANRHVVPIDADHDGDLDLLFLRTNGFASVLLENQGGLSFAVADAPALEGSAFYGEAADIDGDGRMDLTLNPISSTRLLIGTEQGFEDRSDLLIHQDDVVRFGALGTSPTTRIVDLDGDGDLDLFSLSAYFENQGAPTLNVPTEAAPEALSPLGLRLTPNPTADHLRVDVRSAGSTSVTLRILDALGREVSREAVRLGEASGVAVDVSGLVPGVYFVHVSDGEHTVSRPFTVAR